MTRNVAVMSAGVVPVVCSCGQTGQVSAAFVGRKLRCGACGTYTRVLASRGPGAEDAWAPRPAAPVARPGAAVAAGGGARPAARPAPRVEAPLDLLPPVERTSRVPAIAPPAGPPRSDRRRGRGHGGERDLPWEGHVRAIALWWRVQGLLTLVACALGSVAILVADAGPASVPLAGVMAMFAVVFGLGPLFLGQFLWSYAGPARLIALGLTGLGALLGLLNLALAGSGAAFLLAVPGLAWSGAQLWVLAHARTAHLCEPRYAELVARTRGQTVAWWWSPFFFVPAALFAVAMLPLVLAAARLAL